MLLERPDRDGTILIADAENHAIRRYSPKDGRITLVAGIGKPGADGLGARRNSPHCAVRTG